jgi:hypothetical protein
MGLLDDAIREHLDLKRRRGADPGEVERAEREALGPVRRNREAAAATEGDDELVAGGLAYDQAGEDDWAFDGGGEPSLQAADLPPLELSGDTEGPRVTRSAPAPAGDESAFGESAFEEPIFDDEPAPAPPPRFTKGASGDETTEYNVEDALAADEGESDDMLEETPEFLQDTPDHDRLWFEQRPPKDFDFDG